MGQHEGAQQHLLTRPLAGDLRRHLLGPFRTLDDDAAHQLERHQHDEAEGDYDRDLEAETARDKPRRGAFLLVHLRLSPDVVRLW